MAETIQELIVKVTPQGVSDTTDELKEQGDQFEDTADTAKTQSSKLQRFSARWRGAMQVFVGGLAVAAAGLATQVPVLGEVFAGMKAIITSVALAMDSVLRPVLAPITQGMFELAAAISESEGNTRFLIGVMGTIVTVLGAVAGIAATVGGLMGGLSGAVGAVGSVFSAIATPITAIIGILGGPLTLAILGIIATVGTLTLAWKNNWFKIRDRTMGVINTIKSAIDGLIARVNRAIARLQRLSGLGGSGGGGTTFQSPRGTTDPDERFVPPSASGTNQTRNVGTVETTVNIDGRKVGEAAKPFTARGALTRGRGIRF